MTNDDRPNSEKHATTSPPPSSASLSVRALVDAAVRKIASENEAARARATTARAPLMRSKKPRKPYVRTKTRAPWTRIEHDKFLRALELYDRDWKRIETHVGTRTAAQIRSHAQKHFLKSVKASKKSIGRGGDAKTTRDENYVPGASEAMRVPDAERRTTSTAVGDASRARDRRAVVPYSGFIYRYLAGVFKMNDAKARTRRADNDGFVK